MGDQSENKEEVVKPTGALEKFVVWPVVSSEVTATAFVSRGFMIVVRRVIEFLGSLWRVFLEGVLLAREG